MEWLIAASGQEDESDHSSLSSAYHGGICAPAAWVGKLVLPFGEMPAADSVAAWEPKLCGTQQNHSYIRHVLKQLI